MEQILFDINGKSYLLVEVAQYYKNESQIREDIEKYGGIYQGFKEVKRESFWHCGYAILKVLVPVEHALHFNKYFK